MLETAGGRAATEIKGARWVNVVLGNVKNVTPGEDPGRAVSGCYHAMRQAKYARRYPAEAAYRFNRRFHLADMLPRLAQTMMLCKPWPEPKLHTVGNFLGWASSLIRTVDGRSVASLLRLWLPANPRLESPRRSAHH